MEFIYASARSVDAELLTPDADLEHLPGVRYIRHPNRNE